MTNSPQQHKLSLRHNVTGTVYVLHFDPPYKHAGHYIGWTQGDVCQRVRRLKSWHNTSRFCAICQDQHKRGSRR